MRGESLLEFAGWYHALTLEERIAGLNTGPQSDNAIETSVAGQNKRQWLEQVPFVNPSLFAQRLAAAGITEADFESILSEPVERIRERFDTPSWLADLVEAFSTDLSSQTIPLPDRFRGHPMAELLNAVHPLVVHSIERLRFSAKELGRRYPHLPFDLLTVEQILFAILPGQLIRMMSRTAALEVNVMRLQERLEDR